MSKNSKHGSTRQWRALRDWQLRHHPSCAWPGCSSAATEVDHIHQLADGGARFDKANLRSFCSEHHVLRHGKRPRARVDP
jgi:5-methylcytosine-specific restriction endonuclease McrA